MKRPGYQILVGQHDLIHSLILSSWQGELFVAYDVIIACWVSQIDKIKPKAMMKELDKVKTNDRKYKGSLRLQIGYNLVILL